MILMVDEPGKVLGYFPSSILTSPSQSTTPTHHLICQLVNEGRSWNCSDSKSLAVYGVLSLAPLETGSSLPIPPHPH